MTSDRNTTAHRPSNRGKRLKRPAGRVALRSQPAFKVWPQFRDLIMPLSGEELAGLEASLIAEGGARDALVVWAERRVLVDGHHRHEICARLGLPYRVKELSFPDREAVEDWIDANQLGRRNLSPDQRTLLLGRRYNRAKKQGARTDLTSDQIDQKSKQTADRLAKLHGVSPPTVRRAGRFAKAVDALKGLDPEIETRVRAGTAAASRAVVKAAAIVEQNPELAARLLKGDLTFQDAKREEKAKRQEAERAENRAKVAAAPRPEDLTGTYSCIMLDPPWLYDDEGDDNLYGRTKPTYAQMSEEKLAGLPIAERAAKDCHLWMWVTNRGLVHGKPYRLLQAWGFRPVTLVTWCKPSIGIGQYLRNNTEHLVFAVRGSLQPLRRDVGTWFQWGSARRRHSEKPVEAYEMIESVSPGPYLEMFARSKRDGWVSWGAEV